MIEEESISPTLRMRRSETPSKMMQLSESDFLKNMHRDDMEVKEREGDICLTMKKTNNLNKINKEIDLARKRAEKPAIF